MPFAALACFAIQVDLGELDDFTEWTELVCMDCHRGDPGGSTPAHRLDLRAALASPGEHLDLLTTAFAQVRQGFMPPADGPGGGFDDASRVEWTQGVQALARSLEGAPEAATLRRLTRRQLKRTLKSLFGMDVPVERFLPRDPSGYGFDTTGDTLFLTPLYYESWYECVDYVVDGLEAPFAEGGFDLRLATDADAEAARTSVSNFLRLAFCDEPATDEVNGRVALVSGSESWRDIVRATLLSQRFLYRVEGRANDEDAATERADRFTLASRLSFFLHGARPDTPLMNRVLQGNFEGAAALPSLVAEMLDHPRSRSLAEDFAAQWLGTSELRDVTPDIRRFKPFNERLRRSMGLEVVEFFDDLVRQDRSVLECLDAEFVYVDKRLAKHYGMADIEHEGFKRVPRPNGMRGGVLGMAGILTITSNPLRTSPVKRGQWVLERLFHAPAPPPPPNVGTLPEEDAAEDGQSLRSLLAQHRASPACASCHDQMDPYGLALEMFDGIGQIRALTGDATAPVILPNGTAISGAADLKAELLAEPTRFVEALGSALFTYAVGRPPNLRDLSEIEAAVRSCEANGFRVRTLIEGMALITAMTDRQGSHGKR